MTAAPHFGLPQLKRPLTGTSGVTLRQASHQPTSLPQLVQIVLLKNNRPPQVH